MRFLLYLMALQLVACSSGGNDRNGSTGASKGKAPDSGKAGTFASLGLSAMPFGPYLKDDLSTLPDDQVSVEYGYIDVRQIKGDGQDDIFDYRLKTLGAMAMKKHMPTKKAEGCAPVDLAAKGVSIAKSLDVVTPVATEFDFEAGAMRFMDKENERDFAIDEGLQATVKAVDGSVLTELTGDAPPATNAVQVAGAYDATINVNTEIGDISDALENGSDDLLFADVGSSGHDLVVVTLYGGSDASLAQVRCYFPAGGQAKVAPAVYKQLLPLKGIFAHFAQLKVTVTPTLATWTAAISGQGAEDLTIP